MSAESVFNIVQLGPQAAHGTPVPATYLFPVDPGSLPELDRATTSPEEDYGDVDMHHADRGYHGVRAAQTSLTAESRFEDVIYPLDMHAAGGVIPTEDTPGEFEWEYLFDSVDDTLTRYTIEMGSTETPEDQWELSDCLVDEFEWGFDALTVPGASPWKFTATILAKNRLATTLTPGLTPPATLETMLGHFTTLHEGDIGEAFGDLDELAVHLAMFRMRSSLGLNRRKYGAPAGDTFDLYGRGKAQVRFDAMVRISSESKGAIEDAWNVAGAQVLEKRWRLNIAGTNGSAHIDARVRFETNPISDRDGEHVYGVTGYFVKDPELVSRGRIVITNGIEALEAAGS
jgi:hypothetical protein